MEIYQEIMLYFSTVVSLIILFIMLFPVRRPKYKKPKPTEVPDPTLESIQKIINDLKELQPKSNTLPPMPMGNIPYDETKMDVALAEIESGTPVYDAYQNYLKNTNPSKIKSMSIGYNPEQQLVMLNINSTDMPAQMIETVLMSQNIPTNVSIQFKDTSYDLQSKLKEQ